MRIIPEMPRHFINTVIVLIAVCIGSNAHPEELGSSPAFWPAGTQGAVSLTFDDGMPSQLDRALPVLDRFEIKATFYVTPGYGDWDRNIERWQRVAAEGHELGNTQPNIPACASTLIMTITAWKNSISKRLRALLMMRSALCTR